VGIAVAPAVPADAGDWMDMRNALWPHSGLDRHRSDIDETLEHRNHTQAFIARIDGIAAGFAEASLRTDYVNGCETSPVAFLEGIYVVPHQRRRGVAARLVGTIEDWARTQGCREFASDADLSNRDSHAMHLSLGFLETQRVVYFRKLVSTEGSQ
jgi:aminoglycoside 6'-N-acetyltransferase I